MKKILLRLLLVCVCPVAASAQTVTSIGAPAVVSADDFATRAFQDPWDMNERTDLGWFLHGVDQPSPGFTSVDFQNGVFTGTGPSGGNFFLLETGNPDAARIGKMGTNFPIDASKYRVLAFRMRGSGGSAGGFLQWNRETIYDTTTTRSNDISLAGTSDYQVRLLNLPAVGANAVGSTPFAWGAGLVRTLWMFVDFTQVDLDWVRLVDVNPSSCRTITWSTPGTPVKLYLIDGGNNNLGPIALNASNNTASAGCSPSGAGHTFYAGALAPGTYRVGISGTGGTVATSVSATSWVVNDIPRLTFVTPSEEGSSDDFATTVLGNPWDMNALSDLDLRQNVTGSRIEPMTLQTPAGAPLGSPNVFRATSVHPSVSGTSVGDPYVDPLFITSRGLTGRIDASKYRILTFEFGIPDKPRHINEGSIARIVWHVAGVMNGPAPVESVSDDIIFNHRAGANVLNKIIVDMADRDVMKIEQGAFTGQQGWINGSSASPGLDIFRVDPHEFSDPTDFFIKRVKLAAFEKANASYNISWTVVDANAGSRTVTLFYDDDRVVANGMTQIAAGIPGTSYTWNTTGMPDGTYHIYASVSDGANENGTYARWPVVIDQGLVSLPQLSVNRPVLNFGITNLTQKTAAQTVRVGVTGTGSPCWTVDNPLPSIFQVQVIGSNCGNGAFTVSLVDQNYNVGEGEAALVVRGLGGGAFGNVLTVRARYRILRGTSGPQGTIDTPADHTTVSGSVAVTGWAVDDIDITAVEIWCFVGGLETRVGVASRVDDARPDVEAGQPDAPFNYRAGWGYMLLTNFLPGGGEGSYVLRAYAIDREGNRALLGSRTIVAANAFAIEPFGAIDTPEQGQTVSGVINNFGWVLTRGPFSASPAHGATVNVFIDNVAVGSPDGWTSRQDLTTLFSSSTYPGITHAAGVLTFDTANYANGVHTIAWGVTDNNGQSAGVGSRYFTIANSSGPSASPAAAAHLGRRAHDVAAVDSTTAVRVRHGYALRRASTTIGPDATGARTVFGRAMEPLAIDASSPGAHEYAAYLVAGGVLRPIPVGASFDERKGVLYWQPGLGFSGAYDFVILRDGTAGVPIRVVLGPPLTRAAAGRPVRSLFASTF